MRRDNGRPGENYVDIAPRAFSDGNGRMNKLTLNKTYKRAETTSEIMNGSFLVTISVKNFKLTNDQIILTADKISINDTAIETDSEREQLPWWHH